MVRVSNAIWKLDRINLQKNKMSSFPMFSIFVSPLYNGCYWCKVKITALNLVIFLMTLKLRYSDHLNNNLVQYLYGKKGFQLPNDPDFEWHLNTRCQNVRYLNGNWIPDQYPNEKDKIGFYYLNTRQKVSGNGNVRFQMVFGIRCSLN